MWLDNDSPGCKYDTIDCTGCGGMYGIKCNPTPLDLYLEEKYSEDSGEIPIEEVTPLHEYGVYL